MALQVYVNWPIVRQFVAQGQKTFLKTDLYLHFCSTLVKLV